MSAPALPRTPDWSPFLVSPPGQRGAPPRAITTLEGIGDRMRAAAFAEIQAREAFLWGAERFPEAPEGLRQAWRDFAAVEDRHLRWLLQRMQELGIPVDERPVSDQLWQSLVSCQNARDFAFYMASAEERGRRAGDRFRLALLEKDPITGEIFGKIADEEVEHIAAAFRFYPEGPVTRHLADDLQPRPTVEQGSTRGPEV